MKKTFTRSFLFAVCFIAFAGCAKEVKAPVKKANTNTVSTYTVTQPSTSPTHSCGGGNHTGNSGNGY